MKVVVYIQAYNAEKTISRAVTSILRQTHADLICYLCDDASTDNTLAIMQDFACNDGRIRVLQNKINTFSTGIDGYNTLKVIQIMLETLNADYFCELDADDEYTPDFLQKMLEFTGENNLDIAVCGSDFIDAQTNETKHTRVLSQNLIIEKEGYEEHFMTYHEFMRTKWGKLFSAETLKKIDKNKIFHLAYGSDTLFSTEVFRNSSRIGILAESLHKYYASLASVSHKWDGKRILSDRLLHDRAIEFLTEKVGSLNVINREFLFVVYSTALIGTLQVLLYASSISDDDKIEGVYDIFKSRQTQELLSGGVGGIPYTRLRSSDSSAKGDYGSICYSCAYIGG